MKNPYSYKPAYLSCIHPGWSCFILCRPSDLCAYSRNSVWTFKSDNFYWFSYSLRVGLCWQIKTAIENDTHSSLGFNPFLVPCSAHLWVKGDEWEGESIALPDTYTHSLPLSPSLFLSLLYGFLTLYPLLFLLHNSQENPRTLCFPAFKKKLYLDKKS